MEREKEMPVIGKVHIARGEGETSLRAVSEGRSGREDYFVREKLV